MDCKEVSELLSAYQASDLDQAAADTVAAHLNSCTACAEELQAYDTLDTLVGGLERTEPSTRSIIAVKTITQAIPVAPPAPRQAAPKEVMNKEDLAEYLRIPVEVIDENIESLPCFEFGNHLLFRKKSIDEWMEQKERDFGFDKLESEINNILVAGAIDEGGNRWEI